MKEFIVQFMRFQIPSPHFEERAFWVVFPILKGKTITTSVFHYYLNHCYKTVTSNELE